MPSQNINVICDMTGRECPKLVGTDTLYFGEIEEYQNHSDPAGMQRLSRALGQSMALAIRRDALEHPAMCIEADGRCGLDLMEDMASKTPASEARLAKLAGFMSRVKSLVTIGQT